MISIRSEPIVTATLSGSLFTASFILPTPVALFEHMAMSAASFRVAPMDSK